MSYHFIKLFSFKEHSKLIVTYFDIFSKLEKINIPFQVEHGIYQSSEGRNKGYNYILKITANSDNTKFKSVIENEYRRLLEQLKPSLNETKDVFSIEYEPSILLTNKSVESQLPINHVVFLPFNETCNIKEINKSFEYLTSLFNKLPGISSFSYGKCRDSISEKNYVFEMHFSNETNRDNYLTDKQHIDVANKIIPLLKNGAESIIAFDYLTPIISRENSMLPNCSFFTFEPEDETDNNCLIPKTGIN